MFQDELGDLCRRQKLYCKDLGVNKSNINHYEVEFLCDYKKTKVSHQTANTALLPEAERFFDSPSQKKDVCRNPPHSNYS